MANGDQTSPAVPWDFNPSWQGPTLPTRSYDPEKLRKCDTALVELVSISRRIFNSNWADLQAATGVQTDEEIISYFKMPPDQRVVFRMVFGTTDAYIMLRRVWVNYKFLHDGLVEQIQVMGALEKEANIRFSSVDAAGQLVDEIQARMTVMEATRGFERPEYATGIFSLNLEVVLKDALKAALDASAAALKAVGKAVIAAATENPLSFSIVAAFLLVIVVAIVIVKRASPV